MQSVSMQRCSQVGVAFLSVIVAITIATHCIDPSPLTRTIRAKAIAEIAEAYVDFHVLPVASDSGIEIDGPWAMVRQATAAELNRAGMICVRKSELRRAAADCARSGSRDCQDCRSR